MFCKDKIKELYPEAEELMIEPMLIHSSTDEQIRNACSSGKYFSQIKKDGALYMFVKTENYSYLFGRTLSKKTDLLTEKIANVPHIEIALSQLPQNTVILGEIYYPNKTSKDVVSIMGCLPEKAIERQKNSYGFVHYYVYDILVYAGVNLITAEVSNSLRYKILKEIFKVHDLDKQNNFIELAEVWEDNIYEKIGDVLSAGEEGMVLKLKDGIYQPGKRPMDNLKVKKIDYIDAVIIGFGFPAIEYYGKDLTNWEYWIDPSNNDYKEYKNITLHPVGRHYEKYLTDKEHYMPVTRPFYRGWWNSKIEIGAYNEKNELKSIGVISSGINDEMKKNMSAFPEEFLGKVCTIQCMELDKKAYTLRHGFYRYLRNDKDSKDCLLETIFEI